VSARRNGNGAGALLLGIDVGTSVCKAAVVDGAGAELAHGQAPTPWRTVPTGAEVDLEALFAAVVTAARDALASAPDGRVAAIGVASIAESGALLDGTGEALHPAIAWHDARGESQARALARDVPEFTARTGLPVSALCTLAKLAYLRAAIGRDRYAGARRWLNVAEWVVARLGGRDVAELSLSSRTGLLDLRTGGPYADALRWGGLRDDLLPDLVLAGTDAGRHDGGVLERARGAVLSVAGHDHLVAGVGVGVVAPGDVLDSFGTAEALVRVVAPPLDADATRRAVEGATSVGMHVAAGRQALLGGLWSGLALGEVLEALGAAGPAGREELDAGALAIAPGDAPALDLELRSLQRPPLRLPEAPPAAVWRAAIDAVAHAAHDVLDHLDAVGGPHTRVVVTGGWARAPAIVDAKRRLGAIAAPPVVEAGCRGAALLAGVAAGLYESADELPAVPGASRERA
jgi:sugar (pentulose or hexulose) kinase